MNKRSAEQTVQPANRLTIEDYLLFTPAGQMPGGVFYLMEGRRQPIRWELRPFGVSSCYLLSILHTHKTDADLSENLLFVDSNLRPFGMFE